MKLQPYRLNTFGLRTHIKLWSKYYGPFRFIHRVGNVAYKLLLPDTTSIHSVFHVSQLKKHIGPKAIPCADLPLIGPDGHIKTSLVLVLETHQIPRHNLPMVQWLVQWENLPPDDADFIKHVFLVFFKKAVQAWLHPNTTP